MRFKPKSEQEASAMPLIPHGVYPYKVISAKDKQSKKGNPMIEIKLAIYHPDGRGQFLTDYLMESVAYKLRHFCHTTGFGARYDAGEVTAQECEGREGYLRIVVEDGKGEYGPQNRVKDYLAVDQDTSAGNDESDPFA